MSLSAELIVELQYAEETITSSGSAFDATTESELIDAYTYEIQAWEKGVDTCGEKSRRQ